jgi:hypothetical protein
MKKNIILAAISLMISTGLLLAVLLVLADDEILIQSQESRTNENQPVFNKIKYIKKENKDIWMMNKSHFGKNPSDNKWERLAIVIENKKASFYQIEPGPLEWSEDLLQKQVSYRATCFACHNNGPRAIRANTAEMNINWANQVKIFFWNLKIKSYGRIYASEEMAQADQSRETPFRHASDYDNQELKTATCVKCHNEDGFFARGFLKRQQAGTIEFMIENKLMPPPGISLPPKEEQQILDFIAGF